MKALHFDGEKLNLIEKEKPALSNGDALIRMNYAGICNTDLEILNGYMGFTGTPGHEFVGTVVNSSTATLIGKRVVGEINLACGECDFCVKGLSRHCVNRRVLGISGKDGALAEYMTLPERNLHAVPEEISDISAVFTEPLAAACEINEQLEILPEYHVLIIGDGKLAQLIARVVSLYTDKLRVVGKHRRKLDLLKRLNIDTVELKDFNDKKLSYHVVIEATGNWQGWELALEMVRPRGFLVLKSTFAEPHSFNTAPLVVNEITVVGSRCGPFSDAIHFLRRGVVEPTDLVSDILPFSQWEKGFKLAQEPESLKVIFEF